MRANAAGQWTTDRGQRTKTGVPDFWSIVRCPLSTVYCFISVTFASNRSPHHLSFRLRRKNLLALWPSDRWWGHLQLRLGVELKSAWQTL